MALPAVTADINFALGHFSLAGGLLSSQLGFTKPLILTLVLPQSIFKFARGRCASGLMGQVVPCWKVHFVGCRIRLPLQSLF
jgi:hypothetical protein